MNPLHVMTAKLMKQIKNIGNGQKLKIFLPDWFKFFPDFNPIPRWGPKAEDKGRELRIEENKHPFLRAPLDGCFCIQENTSTSYMNIVMNKVFVERKL